MKLTLYTDDKTFLTEKAKQELVARISVIIQQYGYKSARAYPVDMYNSTHLVWNIDRINLEEDEEQ